MIDSNKYKFEKLTVKDGLPSSMISCILQDGLGFIWFGTINGLSKYDGFKFKNYSFTKRNLYCKEYSISSCFKSKNNIIWFGTTDGEILKYRGKSDSFSIYNLPFNGKNFISSIVEDKFGYLWIGTHGNGLYKFCKKTKISCKINIKCDSTPNNFVSSIRVLLFNEIDELLIGTAQSGLYILNVLKESYEQIINECNNQKLNFGIRFIQKYNKGDYLLGTSSGLKKYECKSREIKNLNFESLENNKLSIFSNSVYFDEKLMVSLKNGGLMLIDLITNKTIMFSSDTDDTCKIGNHEISFICKDNSEVIWIATIDGGVYKMDIIRKKFFFINNIMNQELGLIFDLKIDSLNNLWIGMKNGLIKLNLSFGNIEIENKLNLFLKDQVINVLFIDSNKDLWVGTNSNGLYRYNKNTNNFDNLNFLKDKGYGFISSISEYQIEFKNYLLFGSNKKGIFCLDTKKKIIKEFEELYLAEPKIKNDKINKIYKDRDNNLWVSLRSQNEVFKISLNDFTKKSYHLMDIGNIFEDSNNIWIGTYKGLVKYSKDTEMISYYNEANGILDNKIYGILQDNHGFIWVTTPKSIFKFNIKTKIFRNYEYKNGSGNEEYWYSCCIDNEGTLYFGGLNGIDYFNPDEILDNQYIPNIAITDFLLFNESVKPSSNNPYLTKNIEYTQEINLTYKENIFSFEFAALVFNNPKQNQYAYMMEGFDKDWVYCGTRRTATYTNLDPGEYVFRVKGSNNDGIWNDEGTSIKINISPPYWKTWWFKGLGLMSLLASAGYYYKQKLEKLENDSKIQIEFSRKLIDTQENEKKRIAHELHDTIAHEVLISKNKALMALKHKSDVNRMEKTLEEISELSSSTITDVRNIAYNLHPHQLERLGFTKTIKSIINEASGSTSINFMFESDDVDEVLSKESEINLFRVIQESISNIIKHSKATEVILKVTKSKETLSILIVDNGKGFDVRSKAFEEAKHGFGLSGISERIKFLKGEIKIDSELNKGTTLKFKIPIKKSYG